MTYLRKMMLEELERRKECAPTSKITRAAFNA